MPINDPGGHYAAGSAVNQGGPVGPSGSNNAGSNVRSAYSGSRAYQPGGVVRFGWQPDFPGQWAPEEKLAGFDPNMANYNVDTFRGGQPLGGGVVGLGGWNNPRGAGGSNTGQGGMGAGRRAALVRALQGGGLTGLGRGVRMG